jgi:hypothetical protein
MILTNLCIIISTYGTDLFVYDAATYAILTLIIKSKITINFLVLLLMAYLISILDFCEFMFFSSALR